MKQIVEIPLDRRAISHFQKRLEYGAISKLLLKGVDLEKGSIIALLPNGLTESEVYDFEGGGKVGEIRKVEYYGQIIAPKETTDKILSLNLFQVSNSYGTFSLLFEDVLRDENGAAFQSKYKPYGQFLKYGEQLYHYFHSQSISAEGLERAIKAANAIWHFMAVLSVTPLQGADTIFTVNSTEMDIFIDGVQLICVGAYDGESYLIWRKHVE